MTLYELTVSTALVPAAKIQRTVGLHVTAGMGPEAGYSRVVSEVGMTAPLSLGANIEMVYTAHDFVVNNDAQDTIDGSSPVNVGDPIQSQG